MYFDEYIGVCEAYGWEGGPLFSTRIIPLLNGRDRRNADWQFPKMKYALPFQNIPEDEYGKVLSMFMVCQAQCHFFRYRDPLNHAADDFQFGVGTGAQSTFQLSAVFRVGVITFSRPVYALFGTPVITVNGTPTTAFSVDMQRGTITFDSPPALSALLEWTGEYDIWVRFTDDYLPASLDNRNVELGAIVNSSVNLLEGPPPPEGS